MTTGLTYSSGTRLKFLAKKQPMLKFTAQEHLGALAMFLCSEGAETMTGVVHSMDGGWAVH